MKSLRECIREADAEKKAIGHFNISTIDALWSIFDAAKELGEPVIIGVSEGERKFIGVRQTVALVKSLREEYGYPIFLNADHSYSFEAVNEAVDAGFDSVIFDGAELSFDENAETAKKCVAYARSVNQEIIVEGELGYIGKSSQLLEKIPEGVVGASMTTPEQAKRFVEETGVDLLAPSVGNIHGMLKKRGTDAEQNAELTQNKALNPPLDIGRIRAIREAAGVPLVLHGGSGIADADFTAAIKTGMAIVHINTEIRKAWRDAVADALAGDSNEVAPYKLLQGAKEAVGKVVRERIKLFRNF